MKKRWENNMFSPEMLRYIIDPDNITEKSLENKKVSVEKQAFRYTLFDHEKILNDCNLYNKIVKTLESFSFNQYKKIKNYF
jgi:hypothetical protein